MSDDVFDIDKKVTFKSYDNLKIGVPLDGALIGLPGTNLIIISVVYNGKNAYFEYVATLTPTERN